MLLAETLRLVLHQTQSPDNLGSVARAMTNFGFEELVLADPVTDDFKGGLRLAVRGERVLDQLQVKATLAEALSDCVYACGSTSRQELKNRHPLTPEQAIVRLKEQSQRGKVALVLGGEKRGLSDEELALCNDVLVIPTAAVQPSMNLAQAATLLLYLCSREEGALPTPHPPELAGARLGTLQALGKTLEKSLLGAGFLNPQQPELILRELSLSFFRSELTQREAELWLTAFKHLDRVVQNKTGAEQS